MQYESVCDAGLILAGAWPSDGGMQTWRSGARSCCTGNAQFLCRRLLPNPVRNALPLHPAQIMPAMSKVKPHRFTSIVSDIGRWSCVATFFLSTACLLRCRGEIPDPRPDARDDALTCAVSELSLVSDSMPRVGSCKTVMANQVDEPSRAYDSQSLCGSESRYFPRVPPSRRSG